MQLIQNVAFPLLTALALITLGSCCPEDPFVPTRLPVEIDSAKQAYLRVIPADLRIGPTRSRLDGEPIFCQALAGFELTDDVYEGQFWPVDTAATTLSFTRPDGSIVAQKQIRLPKGSYQTAYLYDDGAGGHDILVTWDDPRNQPGAGRIRYRIVNFADGAPPVDMYIVNNRDPSDEVVVRNLGYGDTTAFAVQSTGTIGTGGGDQGKRLVVVESNGGDTIITIPTIAFFGDAVNTLVMTGGIRPVGDEKFIFFNILQDSRVNDPIPSYCGAQVPVLPSEKLYGFLPVGLEISALRLINATSSSDSTIDLTLKSRFGSDYPGGFRRNFPGQDPAIIKRASLGSGVESAVPTYFFLSNLLESSYPFRIERHIVPAWDFATPQPILVDEQPFELAPGRRYSVLAYGSATAGFGAVLLEDRAPGPPPGMSVLRFFHGAFGPLQSSQLRLRVGGVTSPRMAYGQGPDPVDDSFVVGASGSATLQVIDDTDAVVATAQNVRLGSGTVYTVVLSRGPDGDDLLVSAIDENVVD